MKEIDKSSRTLEQWVDYIQGLHHRQIELSLDRVRDVYLRLLPNGLRCKVITISGTNGKGSTAELLASIYRQGTYRVGKYTSPHLVAFNERININGEPVDDLSLLDSFERIELARRNTPITFFEYGTLVAIDLFHRAAVDIAIMEVGLGGRLDAVNILDPDVSIVTSISIDHTSWLGTTIEEIAHEKAGIARPGKPLIVGIATPPDSIVSHAEQIGAELQVIDNDFAYTLDQNSNTWSWQGQGSTLKELPLPYAQTGVQLTNCALALQAVAVMQAFFPVKRTAITLGIGAASVQGRCQVLQESPLIVLDVSHNETSVSRLATFIKNKHLGSGKVLGVCGMLRDKEIKVSLDQVSSQIDHWFVADIHNERGATAREIETIIAHISSAPVTKFERVERAFTEARSTLTERDCLVVFGSFHIVGDILALLAEAKIDVDK